MLSSALYNRLDFINKSQPGSQAAPEENAMYAKKCPCGQTILVRSVRLDDLRTFFLAVVHGGLHSLSACPSCGAPLNLETLEACDVPAPILWTGLSSGRSIQGRS